MRLVPGNFHVLAFPIIYNAVGSFVTEHISVAVKEIGFPGQFASAAFKEIMRARTAVGVVAKVKAYKAAQTIVLKPLLQHATHGNVFLEIGSGSWNPRPVRLIHRSKRLDTGIFLLNHKMFYAATYIFRPFIVLCRSENPSRFIHRQHKRVWINSPKHKSNPDVLFHAKVEQLFQCFELGTSKVKPRIVHNHRVIVIVLRLIPTWKHHNAKPLQLEQPYAAQNHILPVAGLYVGSYTHVLHQKMRVIFCRKPFHSPRQGIPNHSFHVLRPHKGTSRRTQTYNDNHCQTSLKRNISHHKNKPFRPLPHNHNIRMELFIFLLKLHCFIIDYAPYASARSYLRKDTVNKFTEHTDIRDFQRI